MALKKHCSLQCQQLTRSALLLGQHQAILEAVPIPKSISFQSKSTHGCFLRIVFLACDERRQFQTTTLLQLNANEHQVDGSSPQQAQCTGMGKGGRRFLLFL